MHQTALRAAGDRVSLGGIGMHYRVNGMVIASELAAKPPSQASGYLLAFLERYGQVQRALDYGCGKLRYAASVAAMAEALTLVDSADQLDRVQIIDDEETTVRQLAEQRWSHVELETVSEFRAKARPKFDFVLCANVLSAIPSRTARSRALAAIGRRLKVHGSLLVVNQHTNSYFSEVIRRKDVVEHLDGWLVPKSERAYYYGILDKNRTSEILRGAGFEIMEHWIEGQSNYALARIR
jgi:2-polyprenyl-3-methyl-5-hydroxy-6-metoxy-1,4-benzoquinol methylase